MFKKENDFQYSVQLAKEIYLQDLRLLKTVFHHLEETCIIFSVENDDKFRYLYVNPYGIEVVGHGKDFTGKLLEEVLEAKKASLIIDEFRRFLKSSREIGAHYTSFSASVKILLGDTTIIPVKNVDDQIHYLIVLMTERKILNEKCTLIGQERQIFKSVIDHNVDGILSLDLKGQILSTNPSTYSILGYSEKQMTNRSVYNLIDENDEKLLRKTLYQTTNGYALEIQQCKMIHKNGKLLSVYLKTVPIVVDDEIKGIYIIIRDITQQSENIELIHYMLYHDQITGLFNRKALLNDIETAIHNARKMKDEIALLYIDLDRFKLVNDTMGHSKGDYLLKMVGDRLLTVKGYNYKVYRLGGDEYVVLLANIYQADVPVFASKVFSVFHEPFILGNQDWFITPSIGISMYPLDGKDSETLIKKADGALFQVKERGKSHFQFYNHELNEHIPNVVLLELNLRRAIEKNELMIYFQPQFDLTSEKITSFEALLRWNNPVLGLVSPGDFIPIAEDTGLIVPIGEWVIEEVCKVIVNWEQKGYDALKIAVNLSPKQFMQPNLREYIQTLIEKYGIKPEHLGIEITEGAMQDTTEALKTLIGLKELGVSISVDDFGTGYSSLSYLKQFPLDTLKIDQSFIREIMCDKKDAAITTTIIHLAHSLGLEVIAEGVETIEQAQFLQQAQCEKAQGFLYSKPIPITEIEERYFTVNH